MQLQPDVVEEKLRIAANGPVLAYLRGKSAHSDIVFPLESAARNFSDVELYCSDRENFGYVFAFTGTTIFGFAVGMGSVCLKLTQELASAAIGAGAVANPEAGPDWICFKLFSGGGFDSTIDHWVAEAHTLASAT